MRKWRLLFAASAAGGGSRPEKGGAGGFGGRILRAHLASFLRAVSRKSLDLVDLLRLRREAAGEAERGWCVRGNWTQEVAILLDVQAAELHGKA